MRRTSARERALIIVGLVALVGFILAFFVVLPMRDTARGLTRQSTDLATRLAEALRMYQQMPAAGDEIKQLGAQTAELFWPRSAQVAPEVMREIGQLSADLGVDLTSVRPGEPEPMGNCIHYPVGFRVESDFPGIVRLLYELEQRPGRLWVEGVEISPGPRGAGSLMALVHVGTYALGPTQVVPTGEDR